MDGEYDRLVPNYEGYHNRKIDSGEGEDQGAGDSAEDRP
jgi:hypothetical protein